MNKINALDGAGLKNSIPASLQQIQQKTWSHKCRPQSSPSARSSSTQHPDQKEDRSRRGRPNSGDRRTMRHARVFLAEIFEGSKHHVDLRLDAPEVMGKAEARESRNRYRIRAKPIAIARLGASAQSTSVGRSRSRRGCGQRRRTGRDDSKSPTGPRLQASRTRRIDFEGLARATERRTGG